MPKIRPRNTNKAQWTYETLVKAQELVNQGKSIRCAATIMDIPFSSLQKRLKMRDLSEPRLGRLPVFTQDAEKILADRIKCLSSIFYGFTDVQIRKAAYRYAEELQIKHKFDQRVQMAGRDWLEGFLKRNDIPIRKPEATSINRLTASNKEEIQLFFKLLGDLMDKHKFTPKNMYNCDETGISTVQDPCKILIHKDMKRVGERGKIITLLCAMSAGGSYVPPMFIFPRKRMTPQLEKDGPAGAIYKCSDNGWINENLFLEWLEHFANHAKPSLQEPVLLILDNHASHTSFMAYEFCKQNHIHMLSLPPHTSDRMQPLDLTFFGPLKAAYKKECDLFLKNRQAKKITLDNVAELLNKAYLTVASINKGESGFRAAGIFPYNPNHFTAEDCTASQALAQPYVIVIEKPSTSNLIDPMTATQSVKIVVVPSTSGTINPVPSKSCATIDAGLPRSTAVINATPSKSSETIQSDMANLLPFPNGTTSDRSATKQIKQPVKIITSPVKESLIQKENKTNAVTGAKGEQKKQVANKATRRVLQEPRSDISLSNIRYNDEDDDLNKCLGCGGFGHKNYELWYSCASCGLSAHRECTGWESPRGYVCNNC